MHNKDDWKQNVTYEIKRLIKINMNINVIKKHNVKNNYPIKEAQ